MAAIAGRRGPIMVVAVLMMMLLLGFMVGAGAWQGVGGGRGLRSPLWGRRGPLRSRGPGPWHGGRRLAAADVGGAGAADSDGEVGCVFEFGAHRINPLPFSTHCAFITPMGL